MHIFQRTMSNMLCCFGIHSPDNSGEPSKLLEMSAKQDSPISMSVPGASVPHGLDSPDALHKIFASTSSMRGYNAVKTVNKHPVAQGSLDLNFQFGSGSGSGSGSPRRKHPGRLEQLTNHIKQKLSEGRLSKDSEHDDMIAADPVPLNTTSHSSKLDVADHSLSQSQKSLGMTELLASRAASEGGYDSDAKSIQTAMFRSTNNTLQSCNKAKRRTMAVIEGSRNSNRTEWSEAVFCDSDVTVSPSPRDGVAKPIKMSTQSPLSTALRFKPNETPNDVLRRLSNGVNTGTLQIPSTPEIRPIQMPDIDQHQTEWCLSQSDPRERSSLHNNPMDLIGHGDQRDTLRRLANHIYVTKRDSYNSSIASSLISELDPVLLGYIEQFADSHSSAEFREEFTPATAIKINPGQMSCGASNEPALEVAPHEINENALNSTSTSGEQSLHLYSMRISQRLASQSQMPGPLSPHQLSSDFSSTSPAISVLRVSDLVRAPSSGRCPTFIAMERVQGASDLDRGKTSTTQQPEWRLPVSKRSLSTASVFTPDPVTNDINDDSSSYYGSVFDGSLEDRDPPCVPARRGTLKNVNSLAIGGRTASGTGVNRAVPGQGEQSLFRYHRIPVGNQCTNTTLGVDASNSTDQNNIQGRSVSMPKQSRFMKVDSTPTPVIRRLRNSTEADEEMSEIGIDKMMQARRVSDSTQAIEDRRNENFSDPDVMLPECDDTAHDNAIEPQKSWLCRGRMLGWGLDLLSGSPRKRQPVPKSVYIGQSRNPTCPQQRDGTSETWHRAFQRLGEPHDHGRLLATPQFNREGRRKSSIRSASDQGPSTSKASESHSSSRGFESTDTGGDRSHQITETQHEYGKSLPILVGRDLRPEERSKSLGKATKLKKISLIDLGRRVTTGAFTVTSESSDSKDNLGMWSRFASHTRQQRNGPAGSADDVKVQDFQEQVTDSRTSGSETPTVKPRSHRKLYSRRSRNLLSLAKPMLRRRSTNSMSSNIPSAERAKLRRLGVAGKFRKLYRTKSFELRSYTITQGHRGSMSTGMSTKYPELECLPGDGAVLGTSQPHVLSSSDLDGAVVCASQGSLNTISEVASKRSRSIRNYTLPWRRRDAEEWSKVYQDCVGSFPVLRSDEDVQAHRRSLSEAEERRLVSLSGGLRESTVNFQAELEKDVDRAKQRLFEL